MKEDLKTLKKYEKKTSFKYYRSLFFAFSLVTHFIFCQSNNCIKKTDNTTYDISESYNNKISDLIISLKIEQSLKGYEKAHKMLNDSIKCYQNNLINTLKKQIRFKKKNKESYTFLKDLVNNILLDKANFKKYLNSQHTLLFMTYSSSYSINSSRIEDTNRFLVYKLWNYLLYIKVIDNNIRINYLED